VHEEANRHLIWKKNWFNVPQRSRRRPKKKFFQYSRWWSGREEHRRRMSRKNYIRDKYTVVHTHGMVICFTCPNEIVLRRTNVNCTLQFYFIRHRVEYHINVLYCFGVAFTVAARTDHEAVWRFNATNLQIFVPPVSATRRINALNICYLTKRREALIVSFQVYYKQCRVQNDLFQYRPDTVMTGWVSIFVPILCRNNIWNSKRCCEKVQECIVFVSILSGVFIFWTSEWVWSHFR